MGKIQIGFMTFVLMMSICFNLYATEGEMVLEEMTEDEIFDEIHPEDLEFEEVVENKKEQKEHEKNQYRILLWIMLGVNIIYVLRKIGFNRKILFLGIGTISGMSISALTLILAEKWNILDVEFSYQPLLIAVLGICFYVCFDCIRNLEEIKKKTEDIYWKKMFQNGIKIASHNVLNLLNIIFLGCVGIAMLFLGTHTITKEMIVVAIFGSIGMIVAFLVTIFLYSIFNSQKTIYKTISENKLNGERSLKL